MASSFSSAVPTLSVGLVAIAVAVGLAEPPD